MSHGKTEEVEGCKGSERRVGNRGTVVVIRRLELPMDERLGGRVSVQNPKHLIVR